MLWKEKEKSGVRATQMDNLRGLLGIRRMDRVSNARIRELCGVRNGLYEKVCRHPTVVRPCREDGEGEDHHESLYRRKCW